MLRFALTLASLLPVGSLLAAAPVLAAPVKETSTHAQLVKLFADWRAFNHPAIVRGRPDYGAAAMAEKAARLPEFQQRLKRIDPKGWNASQTVDYRYVEAEMNGLDFFLRVLKPWSRDPGFYQTIFAEMSDVPAHEGPSAEPNIDLYTFKYPLSRAEDARLTELLSAVPAMLADAKVNLAPSQAHELWAYGDSAFLEQAEVLANLEAGTLVLNDLREAGMTDYVAWLVRFDPITPDSQRGASDSASDVSDPLRQGVFCSCATDEPGGFGGFVFDEGDRAGNGAVRGAVHHPHAFRGRPVPRGRLSRPEQGPSTKLGAP